jgi:hypothetical protein
MQKLKVSDIDLGNYLEFFNEVNGIDIQAEPE